jgi:hypothetical protein
VINQETARNYVRRVGEPGIRTRLKLFSQDFVENDPDTMEAMEADFMNVQEAHKQFEVENKKHKDNVASRIIGRKYFSEKSYNFLTWSEKEQIRELNKKDSEDWSPDKLSEAFPADPLAITKIIRNYWQPRDEKRIQKHDEMVRKNWAMFKKGEIEVEPVLAAHLQKFAHRNLHEVAKPKVNRKLGVEIPKPNSSEFSSIITSCKKYSEKKEEKQENLKLESNEYQFPNRSRDPEEDSIMLKGKFKTSSKLMPLSEYQKLSPDIVLPDNKPPASNSQVDLMKFKKVEDASIVSLSMNDNKVLKSLEIEPQIKIPKHLWSRGQTYKVNDCFYDDDGEFLYRVPGLK